MQCRAMKLHQTWDSLFDMEGRFYYFGFGLRIVCCMVDDIHCYEILKDIRSSLLALMPADVGQLEGLSPGEIILQTSTAHRAPSKIEAKEHATSVFSMTCVSYLFSLPYIYMI